MQLEDVLIATGLISVIVVAGKLSRNCFRMFQKFYIPSSLIGGMVALLLGPQVLGWAARELGSEANWLANGVWPELTLTIWKDLPSLLISIVFAGLFLGKSIPGIGEIWNKAGPMVMHGQTMAWGQYVIGLSLAVFLLNPVWGISPLSGALIEIGFEGGHGTAAGLASTFRELGFESGSDLALGMATIGVVAGVLLGTLVVNWGVARGHIEGQEEKEGEGRQKNRYGDRASHSREAPNDQEDKAIDPLTIHLGLIALAIGFGWCILESLMWLEATLLLPLGWPELMDHIPLFPFAMLGGVCIQLAAMRVGWDSRIDRQLIKRTSGATLDILIVAALATLSLSALGTYFWAFVILCLAAIAWNLFGLFVLAPRMFPQHWLQNGLANFGQGMGMTVIGLMLVRMVDPDERTDTMDAFGYKQLLFEPVVGGGLFTAASLPLIAEFGAVPVLIGVTIVMSVWLGLGLLIFRPISEGRSG